MFETIGDIVMKRMRFIPGVFAMMLMLVGDSCFAGLAWKYTPQAGNIKVVRGEIYGLDSYPYEIATVTVNANNSMNLIAVGKRGKAVGIEMDTNGKVVRKTPLFGLNYSQKDYDSMSMQCNDVGLALQSGINIKYDPVSLKYKKQ